MENDFIVGFTLFTPKGFRTMYRHFPTLERWITMVEDIEEKLKEYYEFLTIEVEYAKIKTYKIFISVTLMDYRDSEVIKGIEFYYKWEDYLTFTANIEQMRYKIEKAIIKFFRKEDVKWQKMSF